MAFCGTPSSAGSGSQTLRHPRSSRRLAAFSVLGTELSVRQPVALSRLVQKPDRPRGGGASPPFPPSRPALCFGGSSPTSGDQGLAPAPVPSRGPATPCVPPVSPTPDSCLSRVPTSCACPALGPGMLPDPRGILGHSSTVFPAALAPTASAGRLQATHCGGCD